MDDATLKQLLLQARKQYIKLLEFFDLTQQLGQAVDRKDEVSVKELEAQIHSGVLKLPEEDAIRAHQLLTGSPPEKEGEEALCGQIAQNRRLLDRAQELDRRISLRIDGRHSFYSKFRTSK